jgi:pimeloyl-ACP methyl ester carboxylesterase
MIHLNYREYGTGKQVIILHGLFGSGENWMSVGNALQETFRLYLVDQRNHGDSPHTDTFSYPDLAEDIYQFVGAHSLDNVSFIGHSMGGKTAMEFTLEHPHLVERLVVVDIAPREYPPRLEHLIFALRDLDLDSIETRKDAEEALAQTVPERKVRLFLLKNLERTGKNSFTWKINLDALASHYGEVVKRVEKRGRQFEGPVLFIKGERSDYLEESDMEEIRSLFPRAEMKTIPHAGHWLHAEAQSKFVELCLEFLTRNS